MARSVELAEALERLKDGLYARNADGSGNNIENPEWGVAGTAYQRILPNMYGSDDGSVWTVWESAGGSAPNPRDISNAVMDQDAGVELPSAAGLNEFFQFFGQWVTHDVGQAAGGGVRVALEGSPFPFGRTPFVIDEDGVRQQISVESSYFDLSPVYGSEQAITDTVIDYSTGRIILGADDNMLPTLQEVVDVNGMTLEEANSALGATSGAAVNPDKLVAGDNRAGQTPELLINHTIWARNHNYHADQLAEMFPEWSGEEIYQTARALNESEFQHVVYSEYVAKLVGKDALSTYAGYDTTVNATTFNEWATVANRFGHDQSSNDLIGLNDNGTVAFVTDLASCYFRGDLMDTNEELGQWLRGELARVTQEIDGKVVDGNRNFLFGQAVGDLETLDIARGRDHGVDDYNLMREGFGLSAYESFDAFAADNGLDADTLAALKSVYNDDIGQLDAVVGGLLEKHAAGSQLGELFTVITVMQYEAYRDGDRYFYLNRFADQPEIIDAIEQTSLADIIERNTDIDHVYHDAFLTHNRKGGSEAADKIYGSTDADLILGYAGSDVLGGNKGDDDLYAGAGRDKVFGGYGWDIISGGKGRDMLWGGSGCDTFLFEEGSGRDIIYDFGLKRDRIDLSDYGFESMKDVRDAMWQHNGATIIKLSDDGDQVRLQHTWKGDLDADNFIFDHDLYV